MELKARVYRVFDDGRPLKAIMSMRYGELIIERVRLVEMSDGRLIMAMPCRKHKGRYYDCAWPMTEGLRSAMEEEALRAYEAEKDVVRLGNDGAESDGSSDADVADALAHV
ncbi:MAG: septation protein SpoVG family protein [Oscillospiraceae bacterium]|nr:septation protein SpoVG family protein [Oscillospiraceae bacterium]